MTSKQTALSLVAFLAACGGGDKNSGPPFAASNNPEKNVVLELSADGCIGKHNSDLDIEFLMGDKKARFLTWNCGNHANHNKQLVRMFFPFDYSLQCFKSLSTHVGFGRCTTPLTAPAVPSFEVSITDLLVQTGRNAGGLPGFSFKAVVSNTGNVPSFDLTFVFEVDSNAGGNTGKIPLIEPGEAFPTPQFETYSQSLAGRQLILDFVVRDIFGNIVAGRSTSVTVN